MEDLIVRAHTYGLGDAEALFDDFGRDEDDYCFLARLCGGSVRRLGAILLEAETNRETNRMTGKEGLLQCAEAFWQQRWQQGKVQDTLSVLMKRLLGVSVASSNSTEALDIGQLVLERRFLVADNSFLEDLKILISEGYLYLLFGRGGSIGDTRRILGAKGIYSYIVGINDGFSRYLQLVAKEDLLEKNEFLDPSSNAISQSIEHLNSLRRSVPTNQ
ncbi:MAG: hypothetical protein WA021_01465 [Minisyncoccia bacterium]